MYNRSNRFNRSNTFMGPGRSIRNVTWERNPPVTRSNKFPGYQVRKSQVSPRLLTSGQKYVPIPTSTIRWDDGYLLRGRKNLVNLQPKGS